MKYSKANYDLMRFERSRRANKKYDAVLRNIQTNREVRVPFGDNRYEQYKDNTGVGIYSHLDHNDLDRRRRYWERHRRDIDMDNYTAGNFSLKYLW
jgi:hypothetical protein